MDAGPEAKAAMIVKTAPARTGRVTDMIFPPFDYVKSENGRWLRKAGLLNESGDALVGRLPYQEFES
jgi:hypothetical protein